MATRKKNTKKVTRHSLIILASTSLIVVLFAVFGIFYLYPHTQNQQRLDRITTIANNLYLGKSEIIHQQNLFGDKRPYAPGRSHASMVYAVNAANVDTTFAALKKAIADKTDFTYYSTPYPGSVNQEEIFKSPAGEYLRVDVSSKPRDDAFSNFVLMNPGKPLPKSIFQIDPNSGPTNIYLNINLDDNNV